MAETVNSNRLSRAARSLWLRLAQLLLGAVVMGLIVDRFGYRCAQDDPNGLLAVPFAALYVFGVLLAVNRRFRSMDLIYYVAVLVLSGLLLLVRYALMDLPSWDFPHNLHPWMTAFNAAPGLDGLGINIGDYNVPYRNLLLLLAKLMPEPLWLYGVKMASVLFEFVLAYYTAKLVSLVCERFSVQCAVYFAVLALPTVWANAAIFSQCDAIYTAFAFAALYYGARQKSLLAWLMLGLSFSFKLQAIFLMPALMLLCFMRRIRFRDIWIMLASFLVLLIPAIAVGHDPVDALLIYVRQADMYPELTLSAPSVFSLFTLDKVDTRIYSFAGILFAGAICFGLLLYFYRVRKKLDTVRLLDAAFLYALLIPLLLPHMHERYFFCADVLSVVYLFCHKKRWPVPFTVVLVSFLCCYTESTYNAYPVNLGVMGIAVLAATLYTAHRLYLELAAEPDAETAHAVV